MALASRGASSACSRAPSVAQRRAYFAPQPLRAQTPGHQVGRRNSTTASAGRVTKVTEQELEQHVVTRDRTVVIDFFATWCGPCVMLAQELEKAAEQLGDEVKILKIDVDENPNISSQLRIQGLPTLVFLPKDLTQPGMRAEGLMPAEQIVQIVQGLQKPTPAAAPSS